MTTDQRVKAALAESFRRQVENWRSIERYWRGIPADVVTHPPIALDLHKAVVHRAQCCAEYAETLQIMIENGDASIVSAYAAALREFDRRHGRNS